MPVRDKMMYFVSETNQFVTDGNQHTVQILGVQIDPSRQYFKHHFVFTVLEEKIT